MFVKLNDLFIWLGSLINNLYRESPLFILPINGNYHVLFQIKELNTDQIQLWHLHLGYINHNRIQRLVKSKILLSLILGVLPICESYIKGKMIKRLFIAKGYKAKECLELVYTSMSGPLMFMHGEVMGTPSRLLDA